MSIVYDLVGIELETCVMRSDTVSSILADAGIARHWNCTHDGSIESIATTFPSIPIILFGRNKLLRGGRSVTVGTELVSTPLTPEMAEEELRLLLLGLTKAGEPSHATRSSIHIHVGFPQSLSLMKKAVMFSMAFEALFYRLGSMRSMPRVYTNNAIYCRPLSGKYGPPVVKGNDGNYYQISNVNEMLSADTLSEFWRGLGVDQETPQRYHPARYYGINLLSILLHGTLEFRHFNKSLVVKDVVAIMKLCHACTELINRISEKELSTLPSTSIFRVNDELKDLKLLISLINKYNQDSTLSDNTIESLFSLLNACIPVILKEGYIMTHLGTNFSLSERFFESRKKVMDNIEPAGNLDIHHFEPGNFDILKEII